ncbi:MAG TPA: ABC transporter substrate-binding protein, partial [Clostridia bacterium]
MKRRLPVLLLALAMMFSFCFVTMLGCPGGKDKKPVLEVWSMSNEINELLAYFKMLNPDYKYEIKTRVINNDDGSYETALDNAFSNKGGPDLFVTDVDYTKKYVDTAHTVDLAPYYEKKFGGDVKGYEKVRDKLAEDMYEYTLDIGTQGTDKLKAVSYQVTPGAMFYRPDLFIELAKAGIPKTYDDDGKPTAYYDFSEILEAAGITTEGLDSKPYTEWSDADKENLDKYVQKFVESGKVVVDEEGGEEGGEEVDSEDAMQNFLEAAKLVANSKYNDGKGATKQIKIINNLEDIKRVYYAQREAFVKNDNEVVIDEKLYNFLDYAKELYPLTHKGAQWSDNWTAGMRAKNDPNTDHKTLSFFLPTWGLFYVLENENDETAGLWRMIEGPQAYYWGGSYLMIGAYSDKKDDAFEILDFLTSLPFMQARSAFSGDVMNSKAL